MPFRVFFVALRRAAAYRAQRIPLCRIGSRSQERRERSKSNMQLSEFCKKFFIAGKSQASERLHRNHLGVFEETLKNVEL
jgi:hypothetical protein